jgi:DNA polymerase I-like protein with 3'-5' exonuclease and polymerase domains
MKYLTLDCETTTFQKGNPYSKTNKLCYVGLKTSEGVYKDFKIEYDDNPYGEALNEIQELIDSHDYLVGFNIKFDLHWLLRYGLCLDNKRCFDTQLAEFIISNQLRSYPGLNDTAISYGLEGKLDTVATEYWDKGLDTTQVPEDLLREYLKQDVEQTWEVFCEQQELVKPYTALVSLANQDLLTLLEIEHNGMLYDTKRSITEGDLLQGKLDELDAELMGLSGFDDFNPGSGDHISAVLYGGSIKIPIRVHYTRTLKDGTVKQKEKWGDKELTFPQLVRPPKGSELKKEGFYATNEATLLSLRPTGKAKQFVNLIQKRSSLEKLRGTYLHGIPKLMNTMQWPSNMIHGTLNQCVAITGRLSSSKPNMQNFDVDLGYLFRTRY